MKNDLKMTLQEFKKLNKKEQERTVTEKGKHLDSLIEGRYGYALYSIDLFFVEIIYSRHNNRILSIKSFDTGRRLDFYVTGRKLKS